MVGLESGASNNLESLSQAVYRATGMIKAGELQSTLPSFFDDYSSFNPFI